MQDLVADTCGHGCGLLISVKMESSLTSDCQVVNMDSASRSSLSLSFPFLYQVSSSNVTIHLSDLIRSSMIKFIQAMKLLKQKRNKTQAGFEPPVPIL